VTGDDSKSPWADPDPQVFLKALRYIERPDSTASHFDKIEAGINVITVPGI
jgi:hypothetical protein